MKYFTQVLPIFIGTAMVATRMHAAPDFDSSVSQPTQIWQGIIGEGFQSSAQTLSLEAGGTAGFQALGGEQDHDLALVSLSYGHMLDGPVGKDHWYRGNWELRGEVFGGQQFSPSENWLVGLTPHLRYDLATGTRCVPFIDGGAGVSATGIGPPDLSGTFEFNIQGNIGAHWFLRDNLALTLETGYMHVSCAGIHYPNQGLNCVTVKAGLTCFF